MRRSWFRALAAGPLLLLASLLPQTTYIDHWNDFATAAFGWTGEELPAGARSHEGETPLYLTSSGDPPERFSHAGHRLRSPAARENPQTNSDTGGAGGQRGEVRNDVPARGELPGDHATHEAHCHYGASACADQPAPTNLQNLDKIVLLAEPNWRFDLLLWSYVALEGRGVATPTQPPQGAI
jgi:hypothetical protein